MGRIAGIWSKRNGGESMTFHLFWRNLIEILENHFAWQAQYLVRLGNDTCCSAHCK